MTQREREAQMYPAPDANPLQVIQAEIKWLENMAHLLQRQAEAISHKVAVIEGRIHDMRRHLERLEREDIDPNPLGRKE